MRACIAVDFEGRQDIVAFILDRVALEGFLTTAMRLVPCADGVRFTLLLNIDGDEKCELTTLERKLRAIGGIVDVIHCSDAASD